MNIRDIIFKKQNHQNICKNEMLRDAFYCCKYYRRPITNHLYFLIQFSLYSKKVY